MTEIAEALDRAMSEGGVVAYFGYGSLVNRATLRTDYVAAVPARLHGWRRCWRPRKGTAGESRNHLSMLSAWRREGQVIDGLLVFDRLDHLPEVDEREAAYDRISLISESLEIAMDIPRGCALYVYEAHTNTAPHDPGAPIAQSYLDAVMQGFMHEFGEAGVAEFLNTTDGFERPVRTDRHAPVYARSVALPDHQRDLFDSLLTERGVAFV